MTAVTAITAQNTVGVDLVEAVSPAMIIAQIKAVSDDIGVDAVKIGMLGDRSTIEAVDAGLNLLPVLMQNVRLQGVIVGHRESFEAMNRAISQAKLRPVVDKVFPLSDAKAAFEHMGRGDHFGKICIDLNAA